MIAIRPKSHEDPAADAAPRRPGRRRGRRSGGDDRDALLIDRIRQGNDEAAFRQIVSKYTNLVGSIAYGIVSDVHTVGDIIQETFLKVYRNIHALDDTRKFKAWMCSIVRTTCIDHLRKEKVKPASLEKIAEDGLEPEERIVGGAVEGPSLEGQEMRERVLQAIRELPPGYREIILMRHLRRMNYSEIGKALGVRQPTIESRLYRARLLLKEKLTALMS